MNASTHVKLILRPDNWWTKILLVQDCLQHTINSCNYKYRQTHAQMYTSCVLHSKLPPLIQYEKKLESTADNGIWGLWICYVRTAKHLQTIHKHMYNTNNWIYLISATTYKGNLKHKFLIMCASEQIAFPHMEREKHEKECGISRCSLWICYVLTVKHLQHKTVHKHMHN